MIIEESKRLIHVREYYFSKKLREIAAMNAQGMEVINLGIGNPDLKPDQKVIEALKDNASQATNHGYQSYKGHPELRKSISDWYKKKYKVELNPEKEVLPLIGSKEGIMHISMSFLNPGDQVLVPNPGYPAYRATALLAGAECIEYKLNEGNAYLPDLTELKQRDLSRVKIMWINYPHMPSGKVANLEAFKSLVEFAKEQKILLCHDNPYSFILNEKPLSILEIANAKECVLELNSLSKSYNMAGWRIGMLSGGADYIQTVLKFKSNMDSGMYLPLQKAAIEALSLHEQWHIEMNKVYQERKKHACAILDHLKCIYSSDDVGMFVWAKIPKQYTDAFELAENILQEAHVFITPGGIFGSEGDQYLRISLCNPVSVFQQAYTRIEKIKLK